MKHELYINILLHFQEIILLNFEKIIVCKYIYGK